MVDPLNETVVLLLDFYNATQLSSQSLSGSTHHGWRWDSGWGDLSISYCRWYGIVCDENGDIIELNLAENWISGPLPNNLFPTLKRLDLGGNSITGSIGSSLIESLPSLEYLNLYGNRLSGNIPPIVPPSANAIYLGANQLEGSLPTSWTLQCRTTAFCTFTPNRLMCSDGERIIGYACQPCPTEDRCDKGGQCQGGFVGYLCGQCPADYFQTSQSCLQCSASGSSSFFIFVYSCIFVSTLIYFLYRCCRTRRWRCGNKDDGKCCVGLPKLDFSMNLRNLIRLKQIGALLQILPMFTHFQLPLPEWFAGVCNFFANLAFPISFQTPCIRWLNRLPKWLQGMCSCVFFAIIIAIFAFCPVLPVLRKLTTPKQQQQLQIFAGFLTQQAVLISLILSCDFVSLITSTFERVLDTANAGTVTPEIFNSMLWQIGVAVFMQMLMAFLIIFLAQRIIEKASTHHNILQKELNQRGGLSAAEEKSKTMLLPYYSSFCIPYCPASSDFESKILRRKVLSFLISPVVLLAYFTAIGVDFGNQSLGDRSLSASLPKMDMDELALSATVVDLLFFILINTWYLKHLVGRPYISPRSSQSFGDPLNHTEELVTRILIWSSSLFVVVKLLENSDYSAAFSNSVCVVIIVCVIIPQRKLLGFYNFESCRRGCISRRSKENAISLGNSSRIIKQKSQTDFDDLGYELTSVNTTNVSAPYAMNNFTPSSLSTKSLGIRQNSVLSPEMTSINETIEKMLSSHNAMEFFELQQKLIENPRLDKMERYRWTRMDSSISEGLGIGVDKKAEISKLLGFFHALLLFLFVVLFLILTTYFKGLNVVVGCCVALSPFFVEAWRAKIKRQHKLAVMIFADHQQANSLKAKQTATGETAKPTTAAAAEVVVTIINSDVMKEPA